MIATTVPLPRAAGGQVRSHADQRQPMEWTDQHGRPFVGEIELKSQDWCGAPPQPVGWTAPFAAWSVPPRYLKLRRVRNRPDRIMVDYDAWLTDLQERHADWNRLYFELGTEFHGQEFNPEKPSLKLQREMGQRPMALAVVVAMQQGNHYALGWVPDGNGSGQPYTGPRDARLTEYEPRTPDAIAALAAEMDFSGAPEPVEAPKAKPGKAA